MYGFKNLALKLKNLKLLIPKKDLIIAFFLWLIIGAIIVFYPPLLNSINYAIQDAKINIRSTLFKNSFSFDTLLVAIDNETLEAAPHKWPWPQSYWAEVIEELKEKGLPRALVLDIYFQQNKKEPTDLNFIKAIDKHRNTVLVSLYEESITAIGKQFKVFPPIRELRETSAIAGISQHPIDKDGVVRSFLYQDMRVDQRHLAVEALSIAKHESANPELENKKRLKDKNLSTMMLDFSASKRGLNLISLKALREEERNYEFLKDRIVVLGATAYILHDYHQTPMGLISGPEIVCNAIETVGNNYMQQLKLNYSYRLFYYLFGVFLVLLLYSDLFKQSSKEVFILWLILPMALIVFSFFTKAHPPIELTWLAYTLSAAFFVALTRFLELAEIREHMAEAQMCSEFQQGLFPVKELVDESGFCCYGLCMPYKDAGGDYHDFFKLNDGRVFFILCDVSGHGISASMVTAIVKGLVVSETKNDSFCIKRLFGEINYVLLNVAKKKKMVTTLAGIFDPSTKQLEVFSAGHIPSVLKTKTGAQEIPLPNFPLGLFPNKRLRFVSKIIEIKNNEKLFIYSDGIVEARDWNNAEFGFDRLYQEIEDIPETVDDLGCANVLLEKLKKFTKGRDFVDDVSLLIVSYKEEPVVKETA
jgi:CHASE2 domain-containing sensor protein